jgi:peptidylprolyl isomerase domain and WD repeat-containing protein 1
LASLIRRRLCACACRDVFNEKPTLEEAGAAGLEAGEGGDADTEALPRGAVIHTSKGDIALKMFPEECPKTIENFATHARNGYYDGAPYYFFGSH